MNNCHYWLPVRIPHPIPPGINLGQTKLTSKVRSEPSRGFRLQICDVRLAISDCFRHPGRQLVTNRSSKTSPRRFFWIPNNRRSQNLLRMGQHVCNPGGYRRLSEKARVDIAPSFTFAADGPGTITGSPNPQTLKPQIFKLYPQSSPRDASPQVPFYPQSGDDTKSRACKRSSPYPGF